MWKCDFEVSPKIAKTCFGRLQRPQGDPKTFWEKFGRFLNKFLKILYFVQFLDTLCAAFYMAKSKKVAYFTLFLAYFPLLLTKRLHTKYQESAQKMKFFRFWSNTIQTFPRHILGLLGYSRASEMIFWRFFAKSHFRKSVENSLCFKSRGNYTGMEKI